MTCRELVFVTGNRHKYNEISAILKDAGIKLYMKELPIEEPDLSRIEDIAVHKARQAFEKTGKQVITEDTGVYFTAYNNFPGHLAKRIYQGIGLKGLITLIKTAKHKRAYFKTVICYKDKKEEKIFSGTMEGTLLTKPREPNAERLPYEKLFVPTGHRKAVVEYSIEEKNKFSHRAKAAGMLKKWLMKKQKT